MPPSRTETTPSAAASSEAANVATLRGVVTMVTALLVALGVLMVFSASISLSSESPERLFLRRHLIALAVAVLVASLATAVPAHRWKQLATPIFLLAVGLLIAVLFPEVGTKVRGAQRWLRWGSWSLQPAELAKIALVLFLARLCTTRYASASGRRKLLLLVPPLVVAAGLVLAQPDFGTAAFLAMLAAVVMYLGGVPLRYLGLAGLVGLPLAGVLLLMEPYRVKRLTDFAQAWHNPEEAPYHLRQSLITLGSGGLSGSGLGKGWQKLSYLPEANNDFVFAVIGEELGLVGTLTVLALWGGLLVAGLRLISVGTEDPFACLAGSALLVGLVLQAIINIAVVTALLPPKGIPLPLVSYGGSSLLASLVSVGIVLGLTRNKSSVDRERTAMRPA